MLYVHDDVFSKTKSVLSIAKNMTRVWNEICLINRKIWRGVTKICLIIKNLSHQGKPVLSSKMSVSSFVSVTRKICLIKNDLSHQEWSVSSRKSVLSISETRGNLSYQKPVLSNLSYHLEKMRDTPCLIKKIENLSYQFRRSWKPVLSKILSYQTSCLIKSVLSFGEDARKPVLSKSYIVRYNNTTQFQKW